MEFLAVAQWAGLILAPFILLVLYIRRNDRPLTSIPASALYFAPKRCTAQDVHAMAERLANSPPLSKNEKLPPKTGRRYIVVGGGGFLGGWIVTKLLERGEEFHRIRLLDLTPPSNHVAKDALSKGAQFIKVDVTDAQALHEAFNAPWTTPSNSPRKQPEPEITVFHTAANIRFYERHQEFLDRSTRVNVAGTQNVIDASRAVGATVLIYTSSGSVGVHSTRFLLWPWEEEPKQFVQVINDDDSRLPKRHEDFFSNYAATKIEAERLVRAADRATTGAQGKDLLRTGCIRPGNGVFGPRGDMLCGAYLVRKTNPTWISSVVQSFSYVENCAAAHLCYEARLIDLLEGSTNPDIGGQAFCIADPGPTPTYGDVYTTLETLTEGECHFPVFSPTAMLLLSHVIERYYRTHHALLAAGWKFVKFLPAVTGDIINLQPSLFSLTSVHLIFDDSRARLPPEKGGLGYSGVWTTLEGLHKTFEEHKSGIGRSETRSDTAGVSFSFGFKFRKAEKGKGVRKAADKVNDTMPGVAPVEMLPAA
ncbi:NAD(P)-binding protein [Flammula alnicola]|nr:NAD(P)-binding protein [Flammula alnicola]